MNLMSVMNAIFHFPTDDRLAFGAPGWLWALLFLPPLGWVFFQAGRRRAELLSKILAPRLQQQLVGRVSPLKRNLRSLLLLLSLALVIAALAQPRFGYAEQQVKSRGRDVIIAIDTSRSMLATDTAPTRLGRAKLIAQDLLNLLKGDRVGLIAFAGDAFLEAPLTLDKGAVLTSINDLDINTIPKGGTDIASAIRMAIAAFGKGEGTSRALVIMTDGEELDESGVEAAKEAAATGIRIFTIGFGSATGSLIPIKNDAGENDFVRDENGQPVNSKLDAPRLTEIAKETGGFYQPYSQDAAGIIYEKGIVPIDASNDSTMLTRRPIERYAWPSAAALALLVLWSLVGEGRNKSVFRAAVYISGLFFLINSLKASGISDYQQGDYQGALNDFEQRIQSGKASPEVQFDAGAAAYKAGDYQKAAGYFSEAMTSQDPKIREAATYNLANSLVRSGESAKGDDAKLSDWKNSIQHYETVLKSTPGNTQAKENRDIVRKLIDDLKKQQRQQQDKNDKSQKNDQNKDQQKNDKSQGGSNGSDQKQKQDQKNDQNKNKDSGQQPQNDQQKQNGSKDNNGQKQSTQNQGPQAQPSPPQQGVGSPTPTPSPTPGQGNGSDSQKGDQQPTPTPGSGQTNQDQSPSVSGQPTPEPSPSPSNGANTPEASRQGTKPNETPAEKPEPVDAGDDSQDGKMTPNQARALLRSVQDEEAHQLLNQQNRPTDQPVRDW